MLEKEMWINVFWYSLYCAMEKKKHSETYKFNKPNRKQNKQGKYLSAIKSKSFQYPVWLPEENIIPQRNI